MQPLSMSQSLLPQLRDLLCEENAWDGAGGILVIDDDDANRELIAETLEAEGCEVRTAASGEAALQLLRSWSPSLILLDLRMPQMDGFAFARAYHERAGPHAPIIVLTASWDGRGAAETIGAADNIAKPFNIADLLAAVSPYAPCVDSAPA